ncbi:MAG: DNA polymerase IV, partial [Candidatus Thiodiazotropha taylori]
MSERLIMHIDLDAFFASIEQRDHPEYQGRPLVVGAKPGRRGVVATCS